MINGNSRILKWRYVSTIFQAIFCGDIPLHRPEMAIDIIYSWLDDNANHHWSRRSRLHHDHFGGQGLAAWRSWGWQVIQAMKTWWLKQEKTVIWPVKMEIL